MRKRIIQLKHFQNIFLLAKVDF